MTRAVVCASWDDVPHLDEQTKKDLYASIPPHQRSARAKGIPAIGSGAIYPISEAEFVIEPMPIPAFWPKAYGLDVGWNKTAAIFGAHDRDTDTWYFYDEYYAGHAEPAVHAAAIKARGAHLLGAIDPASRGRQQGDGTQLLRKYQEQGLLLIPAVNAVEAGLFEVWTRLTTGRLKVFTTCQNWIREFRLYRRDEHGKVVKTNDHAQDAGRYLVMTGGSVERLPDDYIARSGFGGKQANVQSEWNPIDSFLKEWRGQ